MKKYFLLMTTIILASCSSVDSMRPFDNAQAARLLRQDYNPHPTKNKIALKLPERRNWKRIDLSFGTVGTPIMLVPQQEDWQQWTQSVRTKIADYYHFHELNAQKFAEQQIALAKDDCEHVQGGVIANTAAYSIYQMTLSGCSKEKNQMQIGKAFNGSDAVYLVYYSAVSGQVNREQVERMTRVIQAAKLSS